MFEASVRTAGLLGRRLSGNWCRGQRLARPLERWEEQSWAGSRFRLSRMARSRRVDVCDRQARSGLELEVRSWLADEMAEAEDGWRGLALCNGKARGLG